MLGGDRSEEGREGTLAVAVRGHAHQGHTRVCVGTSTEREPGKLHPRCNGSYFWQVRLGRISKSLCVFNSKKVRDSL